MTAFLFDQLPPSVLYGIAGIIGLPFCVFVIYTYCKYKKLRSHPGGLHVARTISDMLFIISIILISLIIQNNDNNYNQLKGICNQFGVISILFFSTSQIYFIGMCYDLYLTLTYPLLSTKIISKKIHIISWLYGILMSIISHILFNLDTTNVHGCIFEQELKLNTLFSIILIVIPYCVGIFIGFISLIFVLYRLRNGLKDTFANSKRIVNEHIFFVFIYTTIAGLWLFLLLSRNDGPTVIILIVIAIPSVDFLSWIISKFYGKKCCKKRKRYNKIFGFIRDRR